MFPRLGIPTASTPISSTPSPTQEGSEKGQREGSGQAGLPLADSLALPLDGDAHGGRRKGELDEVANLRARWGEGEGLEEEA